MSMYFISTPGDGRYGLLKIVNIISDENYTLDDLDFSTPTRNEDDSDSRNTKVDLFFKTEKGNYGKKTLYYNRAHVSELPTLTISRLGATTYHDVIDTINETYNLFLTPNDIINGPLPNVIDSIITVVLPISPESYKLYDGDLIEVDPFEPEYTINRPEDTLVNYLCMGEDKWAEYQDSDGSTYRLLIEVDSYDCGYSDFNPRVKMTSPNLNFLEEQDSDPFTLEYINPDYPVTVTFTAPGLIVTPSTITLDENNTTATFVVRSNHPGQFNLAVTNAQGVINPAPVKLNIIDRWQSSYLVIPPDLSRVVKGVPTDEFTVIGYELDPDEPVTITIHTPGALESSVEYVVLTKDLPTATFTVNSDTVANYQLYFTNNRFLDNPNPINVFVLDPGTLALTIPSEPVVNDIQSLPFTVTLTGGIDEILVTPVFTGSHTVTPASFILSPSNRVGQFRVTYQGLGANSLTIVNDDYAVNPAQYNFTVLPKPVLSVIQPTDPIFSGSVSPPFTLTLTNGYKPVTLTLTSNVDTISPSTVTLTPGSPSGTFTVLDSQGGSYYVSFNNNTGLANPATINFSIDQVYNTAYTVTAPANLNLRIGQQSSNFTVTGTEIDPDNPLIVNIHTDTGLTSSKNSVTLTNTSTSDTFTVASDTEDTYEISYTNNRGATNPASTVVNVIDPGTIVVTPPVTDFITNVNSDVFTLTLVGGHNSVLVSFGSAGATFTPSTVTLSPSSPTGTFRVRYSSGGNKTITFNNNVNAINPSPYSFTVQNAPSISVVAPLTPIFKNIQSDNFTITGTNIYKAVQVTITGTNIDSIVPSSVELSPGNTTATFKITEGTVGNYTLNFSNDNGWASTQSLNISVNEYSAPVLQLTGPSGNLWNGETSGNFTITLINGVENVTVTVVTDADVVSSYTHVLGPGNLTRTFTVRYNQTGNGSIAITNDKDYLNPTPINVSIMDRPTMVVSWSKNTSTPVYRNVAHVFTASISDIWKNVNVVPTFSPSTGISSSPSNRTLNTSVGSGTFNITATLPGTYVVGLNNNQSLNIPEPITIEVINGYLELRVPSGNIEMGSETDWFEIEMFNYTSNTVIDIALSNFGDGTIIIDPTDVYQTNKILLTNSNRLGRFKLLKQSAGSCNLTITNNQQLDNPSITNINFLAVPYLTIWYPGQVNEILSRSIGPYQLTLNDGIDDVIVTPGFTTNGTGVLTSNPSTLSLVAPEDTKTFSVSADTVGQYSITFSNDKNILNPPNQVINFYPTPTIHLDAPPWQADDGFYIDEETANFTISLTNASIVDIEIIITIDSALEFVKTPFGWDGTKTKLNSTVPSVTFSVKATTLGTFNIAITNNKELPNPGIYSFPVTERTALALGLYSPEIINIEQNKTSDPFTIRLLGSMHQDVTVFPTGDNNLVFTPDTFLLNQSNKVVTFTVTSTVAGNYQIGIDNSSGVENPPSALDFTFRVPAELSVTNLPTSLYADEVSDEVTVELLNPFEAIVVTPISNSGVFSPESFTLDIDNPIAVFTVQYTSLGTKALSFDTSIELQTNISEIITVLPTTSNPFITLDLPSTGIYEQTPSGNFTLTLHNGPWYGYESDGVTISNEPWVAPNNLVMSTADIDLNTADSSIPIDVPFVPRNVNIEITSNTGVYDKTEFILNAGDNIDTFNITPTNIGNFTIDVTNDSSIVNPDQLTFTVNSFIEITITEIEDLLQYSWSSPVTVSCNGLDRVVTVVPVSQVTGVEFDPAIVILSPENQSGTFRVRSTVEGTVDVGVINNQDIRNPAIQYIEIEESDEYFDFTEYLIMVNDEGEIVNASTSNLPISHHPNIVAVNDYTKAAFPNESPYYINFPNSNYPLYFYSGDLQYPFNYSCKEFTFEFYLKTTTNQVRQCLIDYRRNSADGYGPVIFLDYNSRKIKIFDRFKNDTVFETEPNSIPVNGISSPWFQIVIQYVDGILSFYTNGENQNILKSVGSFNYDFPDKDSANSIYLFSTASSIFENNNSYSVQYFTGYLDSVRYTSKARYSTIVPLMKSRHNVTTNPCVRLYEPYDTYLDKNVLSGDLSVVGRGLIEDVVVTPFSNLSTDLVSFVPNQITITPSSPVATFKVVSNYVGEITIGLNNDKNVLSKDSVKLTILDADPLYDNVIFNMVPDGFINTNSIKSKAKRQATFGLDSNIILKSVISKFGKALHRVESVGNKNIYVTISGSPYALDIGAGDFTIEGSVSMSPHDTESEDATIIDFRQAPNGEGFKIFINRQTNKMFIYSNIYLIPIEETPATLPAPNVMFDYAVEYVNGVLTIYINGEVYVSKNVTIIPRPSGNVFRLMSNYAGGTNFWGFVDRIRITKDAYRYGAPYTPSALPFSGTGIKVFSLVEPSNLRIFDTEITDPFTISVTNIKDDCIITPVVDKEGLIFSPPTFTLSPSTPTANFVISGEPGEYEITFKNSLLIDCEEDIHLTIYDSEVNIITVGEIILPQVFVGETLEYSLNFINPVDTIVETGLIVDQTYMDPYSDDVMINLDFFQNKIKDWSGNSELEISLIGDAKLSNEILSQNSISSLKMVRESIHPGVVIRNTGDSSNLNRLGDFTIEIDIYLLTSINSYLFTCSNAAGNDLIGLSPAGNISYTHHGYGGNNPFIQTSGGPITTNKWQQICITKSNNKIYIFVDGVLCNNPDYYIFHETVTYANNGRNIGVGGYININGTSTTNSINGYIDKFKITNNVAKYTQNYIPLFNKIPAISSYYNTLSLSNPQRLITFTSTENKQYKVNIENNRNLPNPDSFIVGFNTVPDINLIAPVINLIANDGFSHPFTISLTNPGYLPIVIDLVLPADIDTVDSIKQFSLDINSPSAEFQLTSSVNGEYLISLVNNEELSNPSPFSVIVKYPDISITGPNVKNEIYVNEISFDLSIQSDVAYLDMNVRVQLSENLSFSDELPNVKNKIFVLNKDNLFRLFKITSNAIGDEFITIYDSDNVLIQTLPITVINRPGVPVSLPYTDNDIYLVADNNSDSFDLDLFQDMT